MTKLLPKWREGLETYIDSVRHVPFDWKSHNCVTFANGAYRAMTGSGICDDMIKDFHFTDASGARVAYNEIKRKGKYQDVLHVLDDRLTRTFRWPEWGMFVACPTAKMATGFALGVCLGEASAFVGMSGLEYIPVDGSELTWVV